jgi:hypothetical protein
MKQSQTVPSNVIIQEALLKSGAIPPVVENPRSSKKGSRKNSFVARS